MPMPRADWRTSSSTLETPTYAFATIGGTASATIAMNAGIDCTIRSRPSGLPTPTQRTARKSNASAGSARPTLAMLTAIPPPRRTWPTITPIGNAISAANVTETSVSCRCCRKSVGMPSSPCQFAPSVRNDATSPRKPITGAPSVATALRG